MFGPLPSKVTHEPEEPFTTDPTQPELSQVPEKNDLKQYGRHGDINPGNILWYDDTADARDVLRGTLKIADFGQAELNTLKSKTKEREVAITLTYRPPECDQGLDRIRPTIRQTYDMWCLGCVYLEFLTWFIGGYDLLMEFTKSRMTPDLFQNNVKTDAFFQALRVPGEDTHEFMVKKAVTRVSLPQMLQKLRMLIHAL
jgi:serine/threonine protein kinase